MTPVPLFPPDGSTAPAEPRPKARARTPRAEKVAKAKAGVPRCMEEYDRLFRLKHGADNPPHIRGGKDGKHFKDLIALWGEDEVVRLLGVFFSTADTRVRSCDYTIGAFYMLAQHLRLRDRAVVKDTRSQQTVDALRRAMGKE